MHMSAAFKTRKRLGGELITVATAKIIIKSLSLSGEPGHKRWCPTRLGRLLFELRDRCSDRLENRKLIDVRIIDKQIFLRDPATTS